MKRIPIVNPAYKDRIPASRKCSDKIDGNVLFSFDSVEKNDFFNLDGTCQNWASELFDTMQKVSKINIKDIYAGKFSGKNSTLRIHSHRNAIPPCELPQNISLEDLWQIRISVSKGGIHGVFVGNVFYVVWFDPHHNLYPNENFGGLKKVTPPSTCCKDRDKDLYDLNYEIKHLQEEICVWRELAESYEDTNSRSKQNIL